MATEKMKADTWGYTARSSFPLQSVGPGHKRVFQTFHSFAWVISRGEQEPGLHSGVQSEQAGAQADRRCQLLYGYNSHPSLWIWVQTGSPTLQQLSAAQGTEQEWIPVPFLFHFSRINHVDHIINGDRCFCNVCRDDDFDNSCRRPEEHRLLFFTGQRRMKRVNNAPGEVWENTQFIFSFFPPGNSLPLCSFARDIANSHSKEYKNRKLLCCITVKTCSKGRWRNFQKGKVSELRWTKILSLLKSPERAIYKARLEEITPVNIAPDICVTTV